MKTTTTCSRTKFVYRLWNSRLREMTRVRAHDTQTDMDEWPYPMFKIPHHDRHGVEIYELDLVFIPSMQKVMIVSHAHLPLNASSLNRVVGAGDFGELIPPFGRVGKTACYVVGNLFSGIGPDVPEEYRIGFDPNFDLTTLLPRGTF